MKLSVTPSVAPDPDSLAELLTHMGPAEWLCTRVAVTLHGAIVLSVTHKASGAQAKFALAQRAHGPKALASTPVGRVYLLDAGTQETAMAAVTAWLSTATRWSQHLARMVPHLLLTADEDLDEAVRSRIARLGFFKDANGTVDPHRLERADSYAFEPETLGDRLSVVCRIDQPFVGGYKLYSIDWPVMPPRGEPRFDGCCVRFRHDTHGPVTLWVGRDRENETPFARSAGFAVRIWEPTIAIGSVSPWAAMLASWTLFVLSLTSPRRTTTRWHDGMRDVESVCWPVSRPTENEHTDMARTSGIPEPTLHLQIESACGQACQFCSVMELSGTFDGSDHDLASFHLELRRARALGIAHVQINGVDPLHFSRILELMDLIRVEGFAIVTLMGPARRLADSLFRRNLLSRAPAGVRVIVPLYGVTLETHDKVTGTPGAFEQVMTAIDGLVHDLPVGRVVVATVVTRDNVHELPRLQSFAQDRGLLFAAQSVYPIPGSPPRYFAQTAVQESRVVAAVLDSIDPAGANTSSWQTLRWLVLHPCVLAQQARQRGIDVPDSTLRAKRPHLRANNDRGYQFLPTVPCEHRAVCDLSAYCPGEHFKEYDGLFGLGEYLPPNARVSQGE